MLCSSLSDLRVLRTGPHSQSAELSLKQNVLGVFAWKNSPLHCLQLWPGGSSLTCQFPVLCPPQVSWAQRGNREGGAGSRPGLQVGPGGCAPASLLSSAQSPMLRELLFGGLRRGRQSWWQRGVGQGQRPSVHGGSAQWDCDRKAEPGSREVLGLLPWCLEEGAVWA